jgi:hypothetical protein
VPRRLALIPLIILFSTLARADTVLVLPFFNDSGTPSLDWIGESVAETVREAFASQGMIALSRDDREEAYRRLQFHSHVTLTLASVIRLGQSLDADQVIYGEFDLKPGPPSGPKTRGTLSLTAHVLDLKHAREGPKFSEVGALEDLAVLRTPRPPKPTLTGAIRWCGPTPSNRTSAACWRCLPKRNGSCSEQRSG